MLKLTVPSRSRPKENKCWARGQKFGAPCTRIFLCLGVVPNISAELCQPRIGAQVLERLPALNDPTQKKFANLRSQLQREPANVSLPGALVRRYISMARNNADIRYLSYAQAALAPWSEKTSPPTEVLVLRVTVLQSTHRFEEALADLDKLARRELRGPRYFRCKATARKPRKAARN